MPLPEEARVLESGSSSIQKAVGIVSLLSRCGSGRRSLVPDRVDILRFLFDNLLVFCPFATGASQSETDGGKRVRRRGNTLVIILAVALLLAVQIYIIHVFTSFGFRHVERTNAHIRAIATAESVFSRVVARLKGAPWAERWFKDGPVLEKDVTLGRATYSSYLATVPHPIQKLADLWVEARYEGAIVPMFWRLRYLDEGLDLYAQIQPQFFTFVPSSVPPPISNAGIGPITTVVEGMINEQTRNRPQAIDASTSLVGTPSLGGVLVALGLNPDPGIQDETFPLGGAAPRDQSGYQTDVKAATEVTGPIASPPPPNLTSPQTSLIEQYPNPSQMPVVVTNIFTQNGLGDPSVPTTANFKDPVKALQAWTQAATELANGRSRQMLEQIGKFIKEMVTRFEQNHSPETFDAFMGMLDYLKGVTTQEAQRTGRAPPKARETDLRPFKAPEFGKAVNAYARWWFK